MVDGHGQVERSEGVGMTLPPRVAPLRMADLFSGTRSVSNVFKARGWEVETVDLIDGQDVRDWQPRGHYDLVRCRVIME